MEADDIRRAMVETGQQAADLAADQSERLTTDQMSELYSVVGFAAPFVVVKRKSDGASGVLEFARDDDGARRYFGWEPTS